MNDIVKRLRDLSSGHQPLLDTAADRIEELERSLRDLVLRCDGSAVMLDESNIDTLAQHAVLGWLEDEEDE
jgi:hypothetical protein